MAYMGVFLRPAAFDIFCLSVLINGRIYAPEEGSNALISPSHAPSSDECSELNRAYAVLGSLRSFLLVDFLDAQSIQGR